MVLKMFSVPSFTIAVLVAFAVLQRGVVIITSSTVLEETQQEQTQEQDSSYYTCHDDASWAVVNLPHDFSPNNNRVIDGARERYQEFMNACGKALNPTDCQVQENWRLQMNMYQPRSVYNYTKTGYMKTKAPVQLTKMIRDFWDRNRHEGETEEFERITTYHNSWDTPTTMVRLDDETLVGGGAHLTAAIWSTVRAILEPWTGMRQAYTSIWGIRIYRRGAVLAPHVDRLPLVSSVIINVDQDVEEPWPLEVYDHDGIAHNITMDPGDIVYYEGHSIIHGRPFPLNGSFFAGVFIHFEPIWPVDAESPAHRDSVNFDLPPYLIPDSSWEPEWREKNTNGWRLLMDPWHPAEKGDLQTLEYIASFNPGRLMRPDKNGWSPLFYACHKGHFGVVQFLVSHGADVNAVAVAEGEISNLVSPLSISNDRFGENSEISQFLRSRGARISQFIATKKAQSSVGLRSEL